MNLIKYFYKIYFIGLCLVLALCFNKDCCYKCVGQNKKFIPTMLFPKISINYVNWRRLISVLISGTIILTISALFYVLIQFDHFQPLFAKENLIVAEDFDNYVADPDPIKNFLDSLRNNFKKLTFVGRAVVIIVAIICGITTRFVILNQINDVLAYLATLMGQVPTTSEGNLTDTLFMLIKPSLEVLSVLFGFGTFGVIEQSGSAAITAVENINDILIEEKLGIVTADERNYVLVKNSTILIGAGLIFLTAVGIVLQLKFGVFDSFFTDKNVIPIDPNAMINAAVTTTVDSVAPTVYASLPVFDLSDRLADNAYKYIPEELFNRHREFFTTLVDNMSFGIASGIPEDLISQIPDKFYCTMEHGIQKIIFKYMPEDFIITDELYDLITIELKDFIDSFKLEQIPLNIRAQLPRNFSDNIISIIKINA